MAFRAAHRDLSDEGADDLGVSPNGGNDEGHRLGAAGYIDLEIGQHCLADGYTGRAASARVSARLVSRYGPCEQVGAEVDALLDAVDDVTVGVHQQQVTEPEDVGELAQLRVSAGMDPGVLRAVAGVVDVSSAVELAGEGVVVLGVAPGVGPRPARRRG